MERTGSIRFVTYLLSDCSTLVVLCLEKRIIHFVLCFVLLPFSADGESTIVCTEDFTVLGGGVTISNPLVVDGEVSCSYTHLLTADDVNDLERTAVVHVTAKDEHDYQVVASVTEVVSLSQVTFETLVETLL